MNDPPPHQFHFPLSPPAILSIVLSMLSISPTYLLYYLPLIITVSLVFGGTRHEGTERILHHAWMTGRWITMFMLFIFAVLCFLTWLI